MAEKWTNEEIKELIKYFDNAWTPVTLYKRINKLNPKRTFEAVSRAIRRYRNDFSYRKRVEEAMKKLRVGYLDIEATQLNANFGFMLSWYIKPEGSNNYDFAIIKKKEIFDLKFDKRILIELLKALDNYDVLYTHYGVDGRFDIPFIRTRAFVHGIEDMLPDYMEKLILDTWPIARRKLRLYSNRLDVIAQTLNVDGEKKTHLDANIWMRASAGDKKSLDYIAEHNRIDVDILEKVHKRLKKIERPIYRSI